MALCCLLSLTTSAGVGHTEVLVNSLAQLTAVMPDQVLACEICDQSEHAAPAIPDAELRDLLLGVVKDIGQTGNGGGH